MKIDPFLKCLKATGIDTGVSVLGVYDFLSGSSLSGTPFIFNLSYPSGFHDYSGALRKEALGLVYAASGATQPSGNFSRNQFYQVSDAFTGNFSLLMALNYSGCLNNGTTNYVVAATNSANSNSGVYLGISPASRLFIKAGGFYQTIPKEVGVGDFAFLSVSDSRFVSFGLFSAEDNYFYNKQYDAGSGALDLKKLCIGGVSGYPSSFTGYSGKMTEAYLFNGVLSPSSIGKCVDCSYTSGYSNVVTSGTYNLTTVIGSVWSGVSGVVATGSGYASIPIYRIGGGTGYVVYDSGKSGTIQLYQKIVPIVQQTTGTDYYTGFSFQYDNASRASKIYRDFFFDGGLYSGDIVEIYTYPFPTQNYGNPVTGFLWPVTPSGGELQLFGNGLAETSGVDFSVMFNGIISGFDSGDYLQYDIVSGTKTMPYTNTYVKTGTSITNSIIRITGASGVDFSLPFKWDVYFDGQKMMSGVDYWISGSGSNSVIISDSGSSWNYTFFDINLSNYQELKFVPFQSGVIRASGIPTSTINFVSGISGFGEQVWVNGVRQREGIDFFPVPRCRFCSGNYFEQNHTFQLYNTTSSDVTASNFIAPYVPNAPIIVNGDFIWDETTIGYANVHFYYTFLEPYKKPGVMEYYFSFNSPTNWFLGFLENSSLVTKDGFTQRDVAWTEATNSEASCYAKFRFVGNDGIASPFSNVFQVDVVI